LHEAVEKANLEYRYFCCVPKCRRTGIAITTASLGNKFSTNCSEKMKSVMKTALFSFLLSFLPTSLAWMTTSCRRPYNTRLNNFLDDVGDMMSGGKLVAQTGLAYGQPLGEIFCQEKSFAIQERAISFTGEDFDVFDIEQQQKPYCRVKGAMMHLPGKDKMRIVTRDGLVAATLDRKLLAITPTYDILRGEGEKIGWLERAKVALTDTFLFHVEGEGGFGPFKPPPAYKIEGDFLQRRFVMKNVKGEVVAKVTKDQIIEFDAFNHYQVRIAEGMDTVLVVACACAIDEEFDEEHKKERD
jgi:uncharacterized protein YxjI